MEEDEEEEEEEEDEEEEDDDEETEEEEAKVEPVRDTIKTPETAYTTPESTPVKTIPNPKFKLEPVHLSELNVAPASPSIASNASTSKFPPAQSLVSTNQTWVIVISDSNGFLN